ncbi:Ig-like domain-containing protein [Acinetobacter lactucae]|uniref:Ig-like domain-containing protein n=1 Tax=Acinetobacter lactucae TaxID=1785128 RepID=UPI00158028DF|nr:Ig-like domain-containing protein [Acinetobacter lactucae]NUG23552.1 Ig-like domain-containing protein [Acinetobacter lactucae]
MKSMYKKQLTLKLSVIAVSIMLASCGGGGGDGYYQNGSSNNNSSGSNNGGSQQDTATALKIELDKLSVAATNDTLTVTVRALDENKGGVAGAKVRLALVDLTNNVSIEGVSIQTTDAAGNAVYIIKTPKISSSINDLVKNGFKLIAYTNNDTLTQEQTVTVTGSNSTVEADTTSIVLFDATKTSLNVRGDQTTVTLTAVDANGSTLANQAITLKVNNSVFNGVKFTPNATQTDANGQISYTLSFSENQRNSSYTAAKFVTDDLVLEANFGQSTKIYTYKLDVVNSDVPVAVGAIAVAYNPTAMEDTTDGVYYYKNISVQVTDVDGKPIPNQDVVMGVNALAYYKGIFDFFDTSNPADGKPDEYLPAIRVACTSPVQAVNVNGDVINQLKPLKENSTVQVVSYINNAGTAATNNKYTTDGNGRFDLKIQYPKIYASWLTVQLTAKSTVSGSLIKGSTSLTLDYLKKDVTVSDRIAPNILSPYGIDPNCANGK